MAHTDPQHNPAPQVWGYPVPDEPPGRESITVPADIVELDAQIAQLRQDKETAVDTESFHAAGEIRTEEKRLLAQRTAPSASGPAA